MQSSLAALPVACRAAACCSLRDHNNGSLGERAPRVESRHCHAPLVTGVRGLPRANYASYGSCKSPLRRGYFLWSNSGQPRQSTPSNIYVTVQKVMPLEEKIRDATFIKSQSTEWNACSHPRNTTNRQYHYIIGAEARFLELHGNKIINSLFLK